MATKVIDLNLNDVAHGTPQVRIYTKANWNDAWVLNEQVAVQESRLAIAPSISTATLQRRFGRVKNPSQQTVSTVTPLTTFGYYVLILYSGEDGTPRSWLGYADKAVTVQRHPRLSTDPESGIQDIPCYGFDRALQYALVRTTVHKNPDPAATQKWLRKDHPAVFNRTTFGNRVETEIELYSANGNTLEGYVFANPDEKKSTWWSTREIFRYVCRFHLPTNDSKIGVIPYSMPDDITMLPDWDKPQLDPTGKSVWDVLTELLSPDRMLAWRVEHKFASVPNFQGNTLPVVNRIEIVPFTRLEATLTLPSIGTMKPNAQLITWTSADDTSTDGELQDDDSDSVEQLIVEGPREIAVGTWRALELEYGWDHPTLTTEYSTAYSTDAGWAALKAFEKAEWNEFFRDQVKYAEVFRRYVVDKRWDGLLDGDPLFLQVDDETYIPYLGNAEFLSELPLYRGVDYEGAADEVDEEGGRYLLPILVHFERPNAPGKYVPVQNAYTVYGMPPVRNPNALPFTMRVTADNTKGAGFAFEFSGAPRHCLSRVFTPNGGDPEKANPKIWGGYDYGDMLITAALRGDRRPQYAIPATVSGDLVRRRIITLEHPSLQHIHIAANTVMGLKKDGTTANSDGGVLRDSLPQLEALARIAAKNLIEPRKHLRIKTGRMLGNFQPGEMIASFNGDTANVVISEIRISTLTVEDDSPPPAMLSIEASTNSIDIVSLVGRMPEPEFAAT